MVSKYQNYLLTTVFCSKQEALEHTNYNETICYTDHYVLFNPKDVSVPAQIKGSVKTAVLTEVEGGWKFVPQNQD